jgi:hypothetical protein
MCVELLQVARIEEDPALPTLTARSTGGTGVRLGGSAVSSTSRCCLGLVRSLCDQSLFLAEDPELGGGKAKSSVRD